MSLLDIDLANPKITIYFIELLQESDKKYI